MVLLLTCVRNLQFAFYYSKVVNAESNSFWPVPHYDKCQLVIFGLKCAFFRISTNSSQIGSLQKATTTTKPLTLNVPNGKEY